MGSSMNLRPSELALQQVRRYDEIQQFLSPRVDAARSKLAGTTCYITAPGPK